MKRGARKFGLMVVATILGIATVSVALPIIEIQDGSAQNPFNGWAGNIEARYTGAGAKGSMTIDVNVGGKDAILVEANTGGDFGVYEDILWTASSTLAGNLDYTDSGLDVTTIEFDFYASREGDGTGAPSSLEVYLQGNGGNVWYYAIDNISDGWNHYVAPISSSAWYGFTDSTETVGLNAGDFANTLGDVDRLGFAIAYVSNEANQDYAFDDIGLHSPEPETYMVLAVALLSMAIVFRKRIKESLAEVRSVVNA